VFKDNKDYAEAVRLYKLAMEMKPNDDEARAALYNMGCAQAKMKQWQPATDNILSAINDYGLKLSVALKDDDLRELHERREWADAVMEAKGGLSRSAKVDLRSEAKTPFRLPRVVLFSGLGVGAAAGLIIISLRLIAALQGGEGAPDVAETVQNFAVNAVAVVVLGALVYRDVQSKAKTVKVTEREELLGRLQIDLNNGRQLPLIRFRGQVRPVIICGSRPYVEKAIKNAQPYSDELRARGVSVVPIILDEVEAAKRVGGDASALADPDAKIRALKRELQGSGAAAVKGFGDARAVAEADKDTKGGEVEGQKLVEGDKKWRLTPYNVVEWKQWVDEQKEFATLKADAKDIYVQVQLDGTVRFSGQGFPPWKRIVEDLPTLDSIRTTLMDGIGTS